ncbi:MAG: hypothetical protein AB7F43_13845 [Bacteriovoracia bacterium]
MRKYLLSPVLLCLILFGFSCTKNSARFKNTNLVTTTVNAKKWRSTKLIDFGAIDSSDLTLNHDNNIDLSTFLWRYPMAVFSPTSYTFFTVFNRSDQILPLPPTSVNAYVTSTVDFTNDKWATSLAAFLQADLNSTTISPGTDSLRPISAVDSSGNAMLVVFTSTLEGGNANRRPLAMYYNNSSSVWSSTYRLTKTTETGDVLESANVAADSYGGFAVAWAQNSNLYYNYYLASIGWRWPPGSTTHSVIHDTCCALTPSDLGVSVGFDGYGNGYIAYIENTVFARVKIVRWKGDYIGNIDTTDAMLYQALSTPATIDDRYPVLSVREDGSATVFFYRDFDTTDSAELWYATAPATSSSSITAATAFGTAARFDSSVGSGLVKMIVDGQDVIQPMVSQKGQYGAVGFIKSDGTTQRFYVSRYNGSGWTDPVAVDANLGDVTWGSVAANKDGYVAVGYSALGTDGFEHVYGVYYDDGWGQPEQLDTNSYTVSTSATEKTRPSVGIDDDGNAVVTFTLKDDSSLVAIPRRRAHAAAYR